MRLLVPRWNVKTQSQHTQRQRRNDAAPKRNFVPLHAPTLSPNQHHRRRNNPRVLRVQSVRLPGLSSPPSAGEQSVLQMRNSRSHASASELSRKSVRAFIFAPFFLSVWIVTREESCDVSLWRFCACADVLKGTVHQNREAAGMLLLLLLCVCARAAEASSTCERCTHRGLRVCAMRSSTCPWLSLWVISSHWKEQLFF